MSILQIRLTAIEDKPRYSLELLGVAFPIVAVQLTRASLIITIFHMAPDLLTSNLRYSNILRMMLHEMRLECGEMLRLKVKPNKGSDPFIGRQVKRR
jgi:hypothetical protein